jgi:hypothetical protein
MLAKMLRISVVSLGFAVLLACAPHYAYAPGPPPPPVAVGVVGLRPGPGYIWIDGYWRWGGSRHYWVGGRWERPPRQRAVWVPGYWARHPRGYAWRPGYWR